MSIYHLSEMADALTWWNGLFASSPCESLSGFVDILLNVESLTPGPVGKDMDDIKVYWWYDRNRTSLVKRYKWHQSLPRASVILWRTKTRIFSAGLSDWFSHLREAKTLFSLNWRDYILKEKGKRWHRLGGCSWGFSLIRVISANVWSPAALPPTCPQAHPWSPAFLRCHIPSMGTLDSSSLHFPTFHRNCFLF